jgi:hypothetical protein
MPTVTVDPEMACCNCPFGKPTHNPWTGVFGYDCYARIFLGNIRAEASTKPGLPAEYPLKNGPITVELRDARI